MRLSRLLTSAVLLCACAPAHQSPSVKQRVRAARDLAKQGSDAIPKLQAMLGDAALEVRAEAVKAIVGIDTAASLDPLIQATRDADPEVQIRAADGLVNFYLPGYVKRGLSESLARVGGALKIRFTDRNDQAIEPYVEVRPEVIAALGDLARSAVSMGSRANAARAVGILRGRAAVPDLIVALRSKDDQVLFESLIALQKIGDLTAGPRIAFLLRDLNEKVQTAAIETTGLLRNREALPPLRDVVSGTPSIKVKRAALTAVAMLPDEGSRALYKDYLRDRDDALRAAAAEGFGRLKNEADLPVIEKAFKEDEKRPAQLADAFALVMLGRTAVSEFSPLRFLVNSLNSSAWRGIAAPYLVELARDASVRKPLEQALKAASKDEKVELARILAASGDKDSVPYLEDLTHDPDTEVAQAALDASRTLKARLR
jgi:HEAT repeat protein